MAYISGCQRAIESVRPVPTPVLNEKQALFLKLYIGRDERYRGNATRSYMRAYDVHDEKLAQVGGSRLCRKNKHIRATIERVRAKAMSDLEIDAKFVLEQSVHLYDVAMGHKAVEVDVITPKGDVKAIERRDLNLTVAAKGLELIGRHTSIQAFQDNVEHTHTHTLIDKLNARTREIEARAAKQDIEGTATVIEDTGGRVEGEKEGASVPPLPDHPAASQEETTLPATGAKGE